MSGKNVKKSTILDSASICSGGGNPKPSGPLLTPVKHHKDDDSDDEQRTVDAKYSSPFKSPKQIYPARLLVTVVYLNHQNDDADRKPVIAQLFDWPACGTSRPLWLTHWKPTSKLVLQAVGGLGLMVL